MVKKTTKLRSILKATRRNSGVRIKLEDAGKRHSITSLKRSASQRLNHLYRREFYCRTIFLGISNSLTQCFLGAINIMVLEYYLKTEDLHVLLGTLGFHFFSVEATLCLSRVNPLTHHHRKLMHVILHICGLLCVLGLMIPILNKNKFSSTPHALFGYLGSILMVLALALGPFVWFFEWITMNMAHVFIGLLVLIASSTSFIISLMDSPFEEFSGVVISTVLVCFIVYYTAYILITVLLKCFFRLKTRHK